MDSNKQAITYLKDYKTPIFSIENVDLIFHLEEAKTSVISKLTCRFKTETRQNQLNSITLFGENLILKSIQLDGRALAKSEYVVNEKQLVIHEVPNRFILVIETEIYPEKNKELSGLFKTNVLFCTQCEPEGFRRITYFLDRPDNMSKFSTTIQADKKRYPVLLSNGNCMDKGEMDADRHWVRWEDPFLKPSYLFALVAGDLVAIEDFFVTQSSRLVTLRIYVERENQDKCLHAMQALKKAMKWDEENYGREYDLDIYMIVAVNDFNMGAMENKGLNIFNAKYILARPETATDDDYQYIDAVVGHEYFHNWSGNRITCRDWFQLSLKEGLTVFREHHFSANISQSPVSLIENTRGLRTYQFSEDASPMAHPVRPDSYLEINNFYTSTIYEKGAEVIRMLKTLIGPKCFRQGMDLYFQQHDGKAVTIEDFIHSMEVVSNKDLTQFCLWYSQAGTPIIEVLEHYDDLEKIFRLTLIQSCPATPNQPIKKPFVIPVAIGLLDSEGKDMLSKTQVLVLDQVEKEFVFKDIDEPPVLSLLRNFSAPVNVKFNRNHQTLSFLLSNDSDDFCRWDASQKLTENILWKLVETAEDQALWETPTNWLASFKDLLSNKQVNQALTAEILSLPSINVFMQQRPGTDIEKIFLARNFLRKMLGQELSGLFLETYKESVMFGSYRYEPKSVACRRLKNICLSYLMMGENPIAIEVCLDQWKSADNMTDSMGVLSALINWSGNERTMVFKEFYQKWQNNTLVLDKWFRMQALSELPGTLEVVKSLMQHPAFEITNPNKVYALIGAFTTANLVRFHELDGSGYRFLADVILEINAFNPQLAAKMARGFSSWNRFDTNRQEKMRTELHRLLQDKNLSKNVFEVISKSLATEG